ncbi:hypothetical protein BCR35DRAFT_348964 [Leucosporidium creatinivorum]|uniref:F-box domain-containing protein n=1 Tax=Leucosporidium creatinivorum TaxID=106004 RepID=A0A1Y2G3U3_9BASI|nr:hypothetical protein BCR35DRAFT_348964 [Leucosporidium creatinivorum]
MLGLLRARASSTAFSTARPSQELNNTALSLPLEIIEYILHLAIPSPSYKPAPLDLRTSFLLRVGLTCRFLHSWAEQRLLEEMIIVQRPPGMRLFAKWLKRRPERAPRVRSLGLLLEETEEMWMREPQQQKAMNGLFSLCTKLRVLRLECTELPRTMVDLEPIAELHHLDTLDLINISLRPGALTCTLHLAWPPLRTREATPPPLSNRSLKLHNSDFRPAQSLPHLTHLATAHSRLYPIHSILRFTRNLQFLDLGDGDSDGGLTDFGGELSQRTNLLLLGIPFLEITHDGLANIPPSLRHLRLHSTRLLRLGQLTSGFAILSQVLDEQWDCIASLKQITLGAGGLRFLVLSEVKEMWEWFQESAERRGVEVVCEREWGVAMMDKIAAEEMGARKFWEEGQALEGDVK